MPWAQSTGGGPNWSNLTTESAQPLTAGRRASPADAAIPGTGQVLFVEKVE